MQVPLHKEVKRDVQPNRNHQKKCADHKEKQAAAAGFPELLCGLSLLQRRALQGLANPFQLVVDPLESDVLLRVFFVDRQ